MSKHKTRETSENLEDIVSVGVSSVESLYLAITFISSILEEHGDEIGKTFKIRSTPVVPRRTHYLEILQRSRSHQECTYTTSKLENCTPKAAEWEREHNFRWPT